MCSTATRFENYKLLIANLYSFVCNMKPSRLNGVPPYQSVRFMLRTLLMFNNQFQADS